ncbi:FAD-binding oxidoreductase, partial [Candidatus Bipolaricaulota bacterium]|nr:FAD-binding oxidoreductase [Candidatus Bipolaricaulota bacterium]
MTNYDLIIIGAGSVGVPAAMAMAQAGVKVLVLDRFASQGQGSNKAAIGGIRATHSDPAKIRLCLRTLEVVSTWEETYGDDIEWTKGGYTFVAYRRHEEETLKELLKTQHQYGLNIDWYDRDDFLKIVPDLNPNGLLGGTFSLDDGHCSTLLVGHAMYAAAEQAGATFRYNERVNEIVVEKGHVKGVKTGRGEYRADVVLNAAGPWAREIGDLVGLDHPV